MDAEHDESSKAKQWASIVTQAQEEATLLQRSFAPVTNPSEPVAQAASAKHEVRIEGEISETELAALKAKYGDSLVSVSSVDPNNLDKNIKMHGHLYTALWEETRDREMEITFDPALIGFYHLNRPSLPEFPFDPELSYVTVDPRKGITSDIEKTIRARFGATDTDIKHIRAKFEELKKRIADYGDDDESDLLKPVHVFGQIRRKEIKIVDAHDSISGVTVFAAGVPLPIGKGAYMMADVCTNCAKNVIRQLIASDPERAARAQRYRMAWMQPPTSHLMGIYAAFEPEAPAAAADAQPEPEDATEKAAVEAISQMLDKTQLFDSPAPNVQAALEALANISVPIAAATAESATEKPPGGQVTPF